MSVPVFLAPMAGVTDTVMRGLCKSFGADLCFSEMISAKGLKYGSKNTEKLLEISPFEGKAAIQLFGSDPMVLSEAMKRLEREEIVLFDINMGCPAPKIVKNGEGSALMKNPGLIEKIVYACASSVSTPVTVKIRKGFDRPNAVEAALAAERGGAAAVTVHGRMREEYYSGDCDLEIIRQVKEALHIPVIGNGDVTDISSAERMLKITGCDGIMIGRGAWGNPFIFRELKAYSETGEILPPPTAEEKLSAALDHLEGLIEYKGEYIGVREMRKHSGKYIKGCKGAAAARELINKAQTKKELESILTAVITADN